MKEMKRVLSLVLCLVMLVGLIPVGSLSVQAVESEPLAVVVAASDFQQKDGHSVSDSVMESIIKSMTGAGYTDVDGAIFCGDYSNDFNATASNTGLSYVYGNYNGTWGLDYDDIVFVQGNHDPAATSYLAPSGENDPDSGAYGVFVINEDDYGWASGDYGKSESEIKDTADNLKTYLDAKLKAKFDAPIFVASHLPLHYSMRTYNDGDCRYAQYIFDVLNEASEAGLNIIYLYGHNHSQSFENYHGGGAVFYSAGDEILIGDTTNQQKHHTETIQFTYLNAGFTGRFDPEDTADPTNTGTVYEIYDDEVVIRRFDAEGTHNLKSAGVQSKKYSTEASLYGVNDRVEKSPQTIELKQFEPDPVVEDETTGISVTAPGITGITVTENENPDYDTGKYSAYVSYDIELDDYTQGDTATVTIPAPTNFVAGKPAVVLFGGAVIATDTDITDGITFTTNHFTEYDVAQYADSAVENWVEIPGESTAIFRLADALTAGKKYVIVSSNAAGNANAVNLSGNNINSTAVTIIADSEGNYIVAPATTAQWTFNNSNKFQSVSNTGRYLRGDDVGDALRTGNSYNGDTTWTYDSSYGLKSDNYIGSNFYMTRASNSNRVYIFEEDTLTTVGGYAGMAGQTEYHVATGRYADQAAVVEMIKENITVYFATEDDYTDAEETDDYQITGTVNPGTAGTYTLTVTYEGKTLGTITVNVADKMVTGITVDPMNGSVVKKSGAGVETGSTMTVTYDDDSTAEIPVTVGMLSGEGLDIRTAGTYSGLTVSYGGQSVEGYTLEVLHAQGNNYPEYPNEGAVKVGKTGQGIDFQKTGVAQVEISTSGVPMKKGADVIIMLDTSSSMNNKLNNQNTTRLEALRASLKNLVGQLQRKSEDGSDPDIRIAVTDFNGYVMGNDGTVNSPYYRDTNDKVGNDTTGDDDVNAHIFTNVNGTPNNPTVASATTLNATAFQDINTIDLVNNDPFSASRLQLRSGTNYDYAFDAIYQLGEAILAQNAENGEERDLFVIFMSDGGPFQYNYFSGNSSNYSATTGNWNDWLNGTYTSWENVPGSSSHKYYYNGPGNTHRMAEAIKGDPDQMYDVIRKDATEYVDVTGDGVKDDYMTQVPGLGATMYSIGFCIIDDNQLSKDTINNVLKKISSDPEQYYYSVDNGESLDNAFTLIGNEIAYAAYNARFVDQMGDAFNLQMTPVVDDFGNAYPNAANQLKPTIEVVTYEIYTRNDFLSGNCTLKQIGDRKLDSNGNPSCTVKETVTFSDDGKKAYSDKIFTTAEDGTVTYTNIMNEGVIYAQNFLYNTNPTEVTVEGVDIPTGFNHDDTTSGSSQVLPSETFYWKIGTVTTTEQALRYYVYLEGSMEGTRDAGSYHTNKFANLYYDNYLENPCYKETVSPVMPWKEANVSYAFYLVNDKGQIIVNQTTGETGSFANKIDVTKPVVHQTIPLNSGADVSATVVASKALPEGYKLYDDDATYTVTVHSGGSGSWSIVNGNGKAATTYVTEFGGNPNYSNKITETGAYEYTHTVVWFAVSWEIQALPDTVVIDYGLPVDISVLANDMFGENGKLAGVGELDKLPAEYDTARTDTMNTGFGDRYTGEYGTAEVNTTTGKVRYTLNTSNGMQMQTYEKFAYAVNYTGNDNAGYYYDTVTVIPATTIYYEDSFVKFDNLTWKQKVGGQIWEGEWEVDTNANGSIWTQAGETVSGATQSEDRPGFYSLSDANNIYGFDPVYNNCSTYSLGSAKKATVRYNHAAQASFTFYGTGFDVISMTNTTTGTILVDVYPVNGDDTLGTAVKSLAVDTYYGYMRTDCHVVYTWRDAESKWVMTDVMHAKTSCTPDKCDVRIVDSLPESGTEGQEVHMIANAWIKDTDATGALWQVPVMEVAGLEYGKYKAVIRAVYDAGFDHVGGSSDGDYDFYLDAIRIYDPANNGAVDNDNVIEEAYKADGEGWPSYIELRNQLIYVNTLGNASTDTKINGMVFIDGDDAVGDDQISDYVSYGPNNEVYLAPGQSVAFMLDTPDNIKNVHIGIKSADGNPATYTITNIAQATNSESGVKAGDYYNPKTNTISTATDMYYDLTGWKGDIIVISNTGNRYNTNGVLSLTNIKSTYSSNPSDNNGTQPVYEPQNYDLTTASAETYVYMTPAAATLTLRYLNSAAEEEVPEETEPETTVPEETEPETTVPEETVPEETEPETTVPGVTVPEQVAEIIGRVVDLINTIIGWIWG